MLWIWLAMALIALVALRYVADSRDAADRNPFAPGGWAASDATPGPDTGYRRAHSPADDLAALSRVTRAVLHRTH